MKYGSWWMVCVNSVWGYSMVGSFWIRLLQRLPVEIHDQLLVQLINGMQIRIKKIYRLEDEFLVCQGRNTGANDDGQVMLLPYDRMSNISIDRKMSENQVQSLFDGMASARHFSTSTIEAESDEPLQEVQIEEHHEPNAEKQKPPSKSMLLARLRERLAKHESSNR